MLLSAVSFLIVAQSSSEIPEGLMNNPVYGKKCLPYELDPGSKGDPLNVFLSRSILSYSSFFCAVTANLGPWPLQSFASTPVYPLPIFSSSRISASS